MKVGTPTPATMTMVTVYISTAILCLLVACAAMMSSDDYNSGMLVPGVVAVLGLILTIIGYFRSKMLSQMLDTPTSLVRSVAVGNPELVGQVRPINEDVSRLSLMETRT